MDALLASQQVLRVAGSQAVVMLDWQPMVFPLIPPPHHPISAAVTAAAVTAVNQVLQVGSVKGPQGHKDFAFYM